MEINTLGWVDYVVIVVMFCINAGIGIYYGRGGRQKSMDVIIIVK